jgi:ribosome maturation factor RimP
MIDRKLVLTLIEEFIKDKDIFIVDIKVDTKNRIIVTLDSDTNLTIANCTEVAKFIENKIDREIEDYDLEVSSAGATSPMKLNRQYVKNIGRIIEVLAFDGEKIVGQLVSVNEEQIELQKEEKIKNKETGKKEIVKKNISFSFDQIKSARVIILFK